jgi:hypothetical protein
LVRGTSPTFCEPYFYGNGKYSGIPEMADSIYKGIQLFKNDSADLIFTFNLGKIHFLKRRNYFTIIERKYPVLFSA